MAHQHADPAAVSSREPYKSAEQIAAFLGIRPSTVRAWARSGVIPSHRPGGRLLLFRESEVEAAVAASDRKDEPVPLARRRRSKPPVVTAEPITSLRERLRRGTLGSAR